MANKPTHLFELAANGMRIGGLRGSLKGAQPVWPGRIASNWYPVNLPAASNGTPSNADCQTLLNNLAPLVARLTIEQSLMLSLCYRTVQSVPAAQSVTFTVNGVTSASVSSWIDNGVQCNETVPVDVVNKNPALTYDLGVRLAARAGAYIDKLVLAKYAGFSNAAVGTAATTPTQSTMESAATAIGSTGEPLFFVAAPATLSAMAALGTMLFDDAPGAYAKPNGFLYPAATSYVNAAPSETAAAACMRTFGFENLPVTGVSPLTTWNQLFTPSALAFASTDMGTFIQGSAEVTLTGTVLTASSIATDEETGTPQLALQLFIANTGSGTQMVYVNVLGAPIVVNPARGIAVKS